MTAVGVSSRKWSGASTGTRSIPRALRLFTSRNARHRDRGGWAASARRRCASSPARSPGPVGRVQTPRHRPAAVFLVPSCRRRRYPPAVWPRSQPAVLPGAIRRPFLHAGSFLGRERAMASVTILGQRRAAAELDAAIGQVERARREQLAEATRLAASGRDPARVHALLRLTEDYLACLRQSRAILLWELPQDPSPEAAGRYPATLETGAAG